MSVESHRFLQPAVLDALFKSVWKKEAEQEAANAGVGIAGPSGRLSDGGEGEPEPLAAEPSATMSLRNLKSVTSIRPEALDVVEELLRLFVVEATARTAAAARAGGEGAVIGRAAFERVLHQLMLDFF